MLLLPLLPVICTAAGSIPPLPGNYSGDLGPEAVYSYVIVGGGTSGLTVAKRLAETPGVSVAVIEAGGFYEIESGNVSEIPAFATKGTSGDPSQKLPNVDWGFVTTPQSALNGREVFYAQGKTLGGGSARNVLAYQRGTRGSYQRWANEVRDQSFTFDNFLPYFERSPAFTPPNSTTILNGSSISNKTALFSPNGGPLHVSYSHYRQPFTPFIQSALAKLGLKAIADFTSGTLLGFAPFAATIDPATETRSSSETSFLRAAVSERERVVVYNHTTAQRILFNANRTATRVLVNKAGANYTLRATSEVIVAAGVFKSPQLLMVSGVGPPATLRKHGIQVISALDGVGQNLWDHAYYGIGYRVNVTTDQELANPDYLQQATTDFIQHQAGPLTNIGGDIIGWEKVPAKYRNNFTNSSIEDLAQFPPDWPELELLAIAAATFPVNDTANYASFTVANVAPVSRGNVTIRSTNTNDQPLISPNWLLSKADQEVAIAGVRRAREIAANSGIVVGPEVVPGPNVQTDAEILAYLRETAYTIHHASATCAMGPSTNPMAVVSTTGKVHGVNGLRVVDASTFPILPPGHCQATVYALAEKYADDIKHGR